MEIAFNIFGILYYVFLLTVVLGAVTGISYLIFRLATRHTLEKSKRLFIIMPFVLLLLAAAAYIINMGWIRFALLFSTIAPLHAALFLFSSFYSAELTSRSRTVLTFTIINYILYPLSYIFLPDGGDIGGTYMFFSLIENETAVGIGWIIVPILFIASFILFILQLIISHRLKKKAK